MVSGFQWSSPAPMRRPARTRLRSDCCRKFAGNRQVKFIAERVMPDNVNAILSREGYAGEGLEIGDNPIWFYGDYRAPSSSTTTRKPAPPQPTRNES